MVREVGITDIYMDTLGFFASEDYPLIAMEAVFNSLSDYAWMCIFPDKPNKAESELLSICEMNEINYRKAEYHQMFSYCDSFVIFYKGGLEDTIPAVEKASQAGKNIQIFRIVTDGDGNDGENDGKDVGETKRGGVLDQQREVHTPKGKSRNLF